MAQQQGVGVPDVFGAHAGDTLAAPSGQPLSFEGEVVEIFEKAGQRLAKIMLRPRTVLDVGAADIVDVHLGDRVVISGLLVVDSVSANTGLKPCAAPFAAGAVPAAPRAVSPGSSAAPERPAPAPVVAPISTAKPEQPEEEQT